MRRPEIWQLVDAKAFKEPGQDSISGDTEEGWLALATELSFKVWVLTSCSD